MKKEPSNERHSGTLLPNSGHTDEQQPTQIERKNATKAAAAAATAATTSVYVFLSSVLKNEVDMENEN